MKQFSVLIFGICMSLAARAQQYEVDTLYKTGILDNRVNVVIFGDGFTEQEQPKFVEEARKFADFFLGYEPYIHYRNYFNFFAVRTPSAESGVTNPGTAPDAYPDQPVTKKNTFFGATFGSGIHRLVTITRYDLLYNLLSSQFPMYDLVVVLVNTPYYGGSGGAIAVHTLHTQANLIGVHEIGHTFAYLADEYWAGPAYGRELANMTKEANPALVRWKNWLDAPGIGIFKHGTSADAELWHKPANGSCLMEYLNQPLCAVCKEATTESILMQINPVERIEPAPSTVVTVNAPQTFRIVLLKPDPNTLQVKWTINGELVGVGETITLEPEEAPNGALLSASIFDSTAISRRDAAPDERRRLVQWTLKSNVPDVFRIKASADSICVGMDVTLTAYGCRGALSWSTGGNGNSVKVKPDKSTTYSASCKVEGTPPVTIEMPVKVMPLPNASASNGGPYYEGATIELTASGGTGYTWSGPQSFIGTGAKVIVHNAKLADAGVYEVKVTDRHGCSKTAQTEVKVDPVLSTPADPAAWVSVSPNPAIDRLTVATALPGESHFTLFDVSGRKVAERTFKRKAEIRLEGAAGLYIYQFTNGQRQASGKVVKR